MSHTPHTTSLLPDKDWRRPLDLLEAKEATVHSLGWVSPHLGELVLK